MVRFSRDTQHHVGFFASPQDPDFLPQFRPVSQTAPRNYIAFLALLVVLVATPIQADPEVMFVSFDISNLFQIDLTASAFYAGTIF